MPVKNWRKYLSKKFIYIGLNVVACLILCALLISTSASAFNWASGSTTTVSGEDVTAVDMILELTETSAKQVSGFQDSVKAIDAQVELLGALADLTEPAEADAYFSAWYEENVLAAESEDYLIPAEQASLFSTLQRSYTFKNMSSIPVYFRIDRAAVTNEMNITLAALWNRGVGTPYHLFPYDEQSGFYYFNEPLYIGQDITVTFVALILDTAGADGSFDFRPDFAEIIQATNNAVYFAESWKNFADELVPFGESDITAPPAEISEAEDENGQDIKIDGNELDNSVEENAPVSSLDENKQEDNLDESTPDYNLEENKQEDTIDQEDIIDTGK